MKTYSVLLSEKEIQSILSAIDSTYEELVEYSKYPEFVSEMDGEVEKTMKFYDELATRLEKILEQQ